jgi:putative ABC transport system permease protein
VKALVAWRLLAHEPGRSALAVGGIIIALLLIFLQLGFYAAVPKGGVRIYEAMRFDIAMTASAYVFQGESSDFPRRRLYQALSLPEVVRAAAFYQNSGRWSNDEAGTERDVFIMAFNPNESVFDVADIEHQRDVLTRPDTILVDTGTRPEFGRLQRGRIVEIQQRAIEIGGIYRLGAGFTGLGAAVTSDLNFIRIFPDRALSQVNLGLVSLRSGVKADRVAAELRAVLPADTRVFTRAEFMAYESRHWLTETSMGLIFGFGAIVAFVVGVVILNQTLTTQITRQLPQYATLKAMGYRDAQLGAIVAACAAMMSTIGYVIALGFALVIYSLVRGTTPLPVAMTDERLFSVLAICWSIAAVSTLLSVRTLRRADPVDLF